MPSPNPLQNPPKGWAPKACFFDVDGVLTTGHFLYNADGKALKIFGPDDNDALSLLSSFCEVRFVTGDRKGFSISKKRVVDDMGFKLDLVSTIKRIDWIREQLDPRDVLYMGDGIFDHYVMKEVGYAISPANGDRNAKAHAHYVTERSGGERAVAEACLHVMEKFFRPYDPARLPDSQLKLSGEWTV